MFVFWHFSNQLTFLKSITQIKALFLKIKSHTCTYAQKDLEYVHTEVSVKILVLTLVFQDYRSVLHPANSPVDTRLHTQLHKVLLFNLNSTLAIDFFFFFPGKIRRIHVFFREKEGNTNEAEFLEWPLFKNKAKGWALRLHTATILLMLYTVHCLKMYTGFIYFKKTCVSF